MSKLKSILFPYNKKSKNAFHFLILLFLLAFCFSIPTFSNRNNWNYLSIGLAIVIVALILFFVWFYGKWTIDIFSICLLLFNLIILMSHLLNLDILNMPKTVFVLSLLSFFLYQFFSILDDKNIIFYVMLIAGILFAFVFLIHYRNELFPLNFGYGNRLGDFFDNQNEISKEFGFFGVISFIMLVSHRKKIVILIFSAFSFLLFLFLILTTGSISNLLTLLLACFIGLLMLQKTKKAKLISFGVSAIFIAVFIGLLQLPSLYYFKNRLINIFSTFFPNGSNYDTSAVSRFELAFISAKIGFDRILFGHGYMSATFFTPGNMQAHNNFVELFVDFGITGLVVFEFMLICF